MSNLAEQDPEITELLKSIVEKQKSLIDDLEKIKAVADRDYPTLLDISENTSEILQLTDKILGELE